MITHLAAGSPIVSGIANWLLSNVGVILLALISIMVVKFIITRRFMELGGFIVLAIIVSIVFYHAAILQAIGTEIASATGH